MGREYRVGDLVAEFNYPGLLRVTRVTEKRLYVDYLNPQTINVVCGSSVWKSRVRLATREERDKLVKIIDG